MFVTSTRNNPLKPIKRKKITTFLKFKNVEPGTIQYNELVYKIIFNKNSISNIMYIGNLYRICDFSTDGVMILQNKNNEMFLVITSEGKKPILSRIYGKIDYRTYLHYIPKMQEYMDHNDINNEALFTIDEEKTEFIAIGEGIENMKFEGYKINFVKKLKEKNIDEEFSNSEQISVEEINPNLFNDDLENLI